MIPKIPKSKAQREREAAELAAKQTADQPTTPEPNIEALASDHADALEAAGLNAVDYGSDDNTGKPDETNPHNELTYTNEESQALPDDPRIDPTFDPVVEVPPPVKGKKGKSVVGEGKAQLPPSATTDVPPPERSKGKGKTPKTPKGKPADQPKVTVERDTPSNLPTTVTNVAAVIATNENFTVTALGLQVKGEPTLEQWAVYGQASGVMRNGLDWADYDWARYGEDHYGESYAQWLDSTGLAGQTLYNRMSALRKYTINERVYGVSISAHVEVAGLDRIVRAGLLKEMQEGKIRSISELRERIKAIKQGLDDKTKTDKDSDGEGETGGAEDEVDTKDWIAKGDFLYEHVGDGMLEPVLEKGKLPAELVQLIKSKALKGVPIKITIYVAG